MTDILRVARLPVAGAAAVVGSLVALALVGPAGRAEACGGPQPRDLPGEAVELTAGEGVWSAWIAYPPVADETVTVLWRVQAGTSGDLRLRGSDGRGGRAAVEFGPSPVLPQLRGGGLQWPRPGREWGTRLRFPHAGCWSVRAGAADRAGVLRVRVGRPAA